ncbi:MAG: hypothetical protein ACYTDV_16225 [Planctomycetota bacterium]|jgi:predicted small secreted protein
MKHIVSLLLILICVVALAGCSYMTGSSNDVQRTEPNISEPGEPPSPDRPPTVPADSFEIVGTVVYKGIEGGFYAIDGDNGRRYDPINLPESFRKGGLRVKVTARRRRDAMSLHMYGAIIEIVNITAQ